MASPVEPKVAQARAVATRRQLIGIRVFVLVMLVGTISGMVVGTERKWTAGVMDSLFAALALGALGATGALALVRCPRCGNRFVNAFVRGGHIWFSYSCHDCGFRV